MPIPPVASSAPEPSGPTSHEPRIDGRGAGQQRRFRPSSGRERALRTVEVLCAELGRGVTCAEVNGAAERVTGAAIGHLASTLPALRSDGFLKLVGLHNGRTAYAPAGSGLSAPEAARQLTANHTEALTCLREAIRRHGREVVLWEVEAVHRERVAAGVVTVLKSPVNTLLWQALVALARPATKGARKRTVPLVERRDHWLPTSVTRPAVLWRLAGMPTSDAIPPTVRRPGGKPRRDPENATGLSLFSSVRRLVAFAATMSGRPVTAIDVRLLVENIEAHAAAPPDGDADNAEPSTLTLLARTVPRARINTLLNMTGVEDAKRPPHPRRLRVIQSRLTGLGAGPIRYRLGEATPLELACAAVEDTGVYLHAATEVQAIAALRRRAARAASPALAHLAWLRDEVLRQRLWEALGAQPVELVRSRIARALDWRHALIEDRPRPQAPARRAASHLENRRRWRQQIDAHVLAAADALGGAPQASRWVRPFVTVGDGPLVSWDEMWPLLQSTIAQDGSGASEAGIVSRARHAMTDARRVPNRAARREGKVGTVENETLLFLDRVDAFYAAFQRTQGSVTRMLLRNARALTGEVLRDPALVTGWLGAEEHLDPASRRALVVYGGLLGTLLPVAAAVRDLEDSGDAAAWVLSCVLAGPAEAPDRLEASRGEFVGGAADVVDMAQRRLAAGRLAAIVG